MNFSSKTPPQSHLTMEEGCNDGDNDELVNNSRAEEQRILRKGHQNNVRVTYSRKHCVRARARVCVCVCARALGGGGGGAAGGKAIPPSHGHALKFLNERYLK